MRIKSIFRSQFDPILQWDNFIKNHPDQLSESIAESSFVPDFKINEDFMLVAAIHNTVNNLCEYKRDEIGRDIWKMFSYFGDSGDCEDFVLTKRALLIHAGIPVGCLQPMVCSIKRTGEQHMVLLIKEKSKDYVLDLHPNEPIETLEHVLKRLDPITILNNGIWCNLQVTTNDII